MAARNGPGAPEERTLHGQLVRLFRRQLVTAAVLAGIFLLLRDSWLTMLLSLGAGLCDTFLFLHGIDRGMQKTPAGAAAHMRWVMFERIAGLLLFAAAAVLLKARVERVFIAYLAFYVCLVVHMATLGIHIKK